MANLSKNIHNGLLLIDLERSFTKGSWAAYFGYDQVQPIEIACQKIKTLLESDRVIRKHNYYSSADTEIRNADLIDPRAILKDSYILNDNILCTKCYLNTPEYSEFEESVIDFFKKENIPFVHKPTMNVCSNPKFHEWMRYRMAQGNSSGQASLQKLYIAGCTTTSCIRISSCEIKKSYPDLEVVVLLDLCGARMDNYTKNAESDETLVRLYGKENCIGKSAVDLAVLQMTMAGVIVI